MPALEVRTWQFVVVCVAATFAYGLFGWFPAWLLMIAATVTWTVENVKRRWRG